ncbi:MAG: hypothetical protein WCO98_04445 [bacterium]
MKNIFYHHLLLTIALCIFVLFTISASAEQAAWDLTAAELAPRSGQTAHIVDIDAGKTMELDGPLKLEMYGLQSRLTEGWWRITFKLTPDRAAKENEQLDCSIWNPYGTPGAYRFNTVITPTDFGAGNKQVSFTRQMHAGPGNGNVGILLRGGWKGLRLDGIYFEPLIDPLFLTSIRADKLVYKLKEIGSATVVIRNGAAKPQTARLVVEVESGLGKPATISDAEIEIPAGGKDPYNVSVKLPVLPEYGHQLKATLSKTGKDGEVIGEARDWFYVSDKPVRIGHLAAWGSDKDYEPKNVDEFIGNMRKNCFPLAEITFWAPDDFSMLTPPEGKDRWWSGQTLAQLSSKTIDARIKAAHAQGMQVLSYADLRVDFGFRVSELFRQHPEWCNWDSNDEMMGWSNGEITRQLREDDNERFDPETKKARFGARGVWGPQTGMPGPVDYHISQLVASTKRFDWDGFRYDDLYDYDFAGADMLGNKVPYKGMTSPVLISRLRTALDKAKPGMIYGHNMEWSKEHHPPFEQVMPFDTPPMPNDYYTEYLRDDGLHLQERVTAYWGTGTNWDTIAEQTNSLGNNSARRGGHAYAITPAHNYAYDSRTMTALMMAGRVHLAYWASDWQLPYLRLATRHCDLLYGDSLRPVSDDILKLNKKSDRDLWWKQYIRVLEPSAGKRVYFVHLINKPEKPGVDSKNLLPPPAIDGLELTWSLPAGWKAERAWQITADRSEGVETSIGSNEKCETTTVTAGAMPIREDLPITKQDKSVIVKPSALIQWTIVAVECSGPVNDKLPAWRYSLPPMPAQPKDFTTEPLPANYTPNGFPPVVFSAGHQMWKLQKVRVDDASCVDGKAVKVQAPLSTEAYFGGVSGGKYRFSLRVKSPDAPPADGKIHFRCWPAGRIWTVDQDFPLVDVKPGVWTDLAIETTIGWDRGNCGVQVTGGWDGLLIDRLEVRELKGLSETERITEQKLQTWPADMVPAKDGGAWCMMGIWNESLHVPEVLKNLNVPVSECDWYVYRSQRGWNGPQLNKPEDLAKYRLVVLSNVDIRTLSIEKRGWLKSWVEAGGSLLMTGGPYGLGRGWWQESELISSILPATLKSFDLKPLGEKKALTLKGEGKLANLDLGQATTIWLHELTPKAGAQTVLTADGKPAMIFGEAGKGKVALLALAPLGENTANSWWRTDAGKKITDAACRWLLGK